MPVALLAAAVTAGASVYAANKQSSAAKSASRTAAQTADQQIAFQRQAREEARTQLTPYSTEGAAARSMYNAAMGIAPGGATGTAGADSLTAARAAYDAGFTNSPYWQDAQYATGEAMNALRSTNAAMGRGSSINSGKALRAASDIQQGYRGQATQNYLNSLAGVAGTGFQADTGIASGGQVFANAAQNALAQSSALQGQYALQGAQAYGQAASNISGVAGYLAGNYMNGGQNYFREPQPLTSVGQPGQAPMAPDPWSWSDLRLKRDIALIGPDRNGLRWWTYRYLWDADDAPLRVGVMAHEAPTHAVRADANGYLMVNYAELGG